MKRLKVVSDAFRSIGYHDDSQTLEVEFKNGHVYSYPKVPKRLHTRFINAESQGNFFHSYIRPVHKGIAMGVDKDTVATDEEVLD